jgi:hypothetical protein
MGDKKNYWWYSTKSHQRTYILIYVQLRFKSEPLMHQERENLEAKISENLPAL